MCPLFDKPNLCGTGQIAAEVMMMMMTWLIEIFKHTWLRFNFSGPFFFVPAPPCQWFFKTGMAHPHSPDGETEAGQGLLGCRKAEPELTRAFGKLPHSFPLFSCFPWKQRLCSCVVCPSARSLLVYGFEPGGQVHPQMCVFQGCFVELGSSAGRRRKTKVFLHWEEDSRVCWTSWLATWDSTWEGATRNQLQSSAAPGTPCKSLTL